MGYASKDKKPLSEVAVIDDDTIDKIIKKLPPSNVELTQAQLDYIVSQVGSSEGSGNIDGGSPETTIEDSIIINIGEI
jgi:hypothetical protein